MIDSLLLLLQYLPPSNYRQLIFEKEKEEEGEEEKEKVEMMTRMTKRKGLRERGFATLRGRI